MDNQQSRLCDCCGEEFISNRHNKRFCSKVCYHNRNKNKSKKTFKPKNCQVCEEIFTPSGPASKFCDTCSLSIYDDKKKVSDLKYRSKHQVIGVGSGGNQGKGSNHHSYVSGIGNYKQHMGEFCNRCDKPAVLVHHIDHDRLNNNLDNLESLCKRCHQIEHECWKAFDSKIQRLSARSKA